MKRVLLPFGALMLLLPSVKPAAALAPDQIGYYVCSSIDQGVGYCSSQQSTSLVNGVVYAEDEIQGYCLYGFNPWASAWAFATCGPAVATAASGSLFALVFSKSALVGPFIVPPGFYSQDCNGFVTTDSDAYGPCNGTPGGGTGGGGDIDPKQIE